MFRTGALILIAALAAGGQILPIPKPANGGQPIGSEHRHSQPQGQPAKQQAASKPIPGSTASAPLYVKARCEHGCGYAEGYEGFWQRLETDPLALFTAVLALVTVVLAG